jgi:hypothetical protein
MFGLLLFGQPWLLSIEDDDSSSSGFRFRLVSFLTSSSMNCSSCLSLYVARRCKISPIVSSFRFRVEGDAPSILG